MQRAGMRRIAYTGTDPAVDQFARGVSDVLKYQQALPSSDGTLFSDVDFGASGSAGQFPLKHTMNRKARGVLVMSCKPRSITTPSCPAGMPVHFPVNDTESTAFVYLTTSMVTDFLWSFWVW